MKKNMIFGLNKKKKSVTGPACLLDDLWKNFCKNYSFARSILVADQSNVHIILRKTKIQ